MNEIYLNSALLNSLYRNVFVESPTSESHDEKSNNIISQEAIGFARFISLADLLDFNDCQTRAISRPRFKNQEKRAHED